MEQENKDDEMSTINEGEKEADEAPEDAAQQEPQEDDVQPETGEETQQESNDDAAATEADQTVDAPEELTVEEAAKPEEETEADAKEAEEAPVDQVDVEAEQVEETADGDEDKGEVTEDAPSAEQETGEGKEDDAVQEAAQDGDETEAVKDNEEESADVKEPQEETEAKTDEKEGEEGEAAEEGAEGTTEAETADARPVSGEPIPPITEGIPEEDEEAVKTAEEEGEDVEKPTSEREDDEADEREGSQIPDEGHEEYEDEDEEEEEYEEEVEEEEFDREALIQHYKEAVAVRDQKRQQNLLLQTKLSEYFRKKKADQGQPETQEVEKSVTDQEQRYVKFLNNLEEMRKERDLKKEDYEDTIMHMEEECQRREEMVKDMYQALLNFKKNVGSKSVSVTNGRPFPPISQRRQDDGGVKKAHDLLSTSVDDMLGEEAEIEDQVIRVRLENISLQNKKNKHETTLKSKDELSEGLHMIDFEQLKIENQTYNEKIEERQEELLKLKKKITNNVQILTHLKEKLQFVQMKKKQQHNSLEDLDKTLSRRRDQLTRTKQARDALRNDNQKLKQNSGLLGNEPLLRNFEENVDLVAEKKSRLEHLKMEHAEVTLQCNKLKRKIEQVRATSAN